MAHKRVICPMTGKLEEIDFERTPAGIVIAGCTRFDPRDAVECGRTCAARLDARDRRGVDDRTERVLVVFADAETRAIAESLARHLRADGLIVELADATTRACPPAADYEAVVIGSRTQFGRPARSVIDYIVHNRDALADLPAFFFTVGRGSLTRMIRETGWSPQASVRLGAIDRDDEVRALAARIVDETPPLGLEPTMH